VWSVPTPRCSSCRRTTSSRLRRIASSWHLASRSCPSHLRWTIFRTVQAALVYRAEQARRPATRVSPSSQLSHADKSMLNTTTEQKRQSVGINPPYQRPDAERRPLGGNYLQLHRGPRLQPGLGSDFRTTRADVHGARQVSARPDVDDDRPGHSGARVAPPVLLPPKRHDGHSRRLMSTRNRPAHCLPRPGVQPRASNEQRGDAPSEEP